MNDDEEMFVMDAGHVGLGAEKRVELQVGRVRKATVLGQVLPLLSVIQAVVLGVRAAHRGGCGLFRATSGFPSASQTWVAVVTTEPPTSRDMKVIRFPPKKRTKHPV